MSNYLIQGETLTNIANAIRTKTGKTDSIATENMASEISGIPVYPVYNGAYEVNKSGYTVTITGTTDGGYDTDGIDYSTDNGLSGFAKCGETVVLEGVSSITLSNFNAPMGYVEVNGENIGMPTSETTIAITQDTSIYVTCIYAS